MSSSRTSIFVSFANMSYKYNVINPRFSFQIPECVVKVDGKFKCTLCRAEAKTLDILQAHLSSKGHRKRTAPIKEYRCEPCNLVVSSEETLRQHFEGSKRLVGLQAHIYIFYVISVRHHVEENIYL